MSDFPPQQPHAVIIGGGIAGLAAAFFLRDAPVRVTVLEGSARPGGKLAVSEVAGTPVDEGAESLLTRRPEGISLVSAAGLSGDMAAPGTLAARIFTRGQMCPLPARHVMGVPADPGELAGTGLLSQPGLERAARDLRMPATSRDGDVSVASFLGARFGAELVDRLIDPLLGGVYAGRSDHLSFEATLPGLARESQRHASVARAAAALLPAPGSAPHQPPGMSVFTTLPGGLGSLAPRLAAASGATIRTGVMVRELARTASGWRLVTGSAHAPGHVDADAVVLAVPAAPASRLLAGVPGASVAATALAGIRYASMVIVTLAYPVNAFPRLPAISGYLVPAVDGHAVKAVTFSSVKWPHVGKGTGLLFARCSLGRIGEEAMLQAGDGELARTAATELAGATGVTGPPAATRVTRWGGALPQYDVGHLARVAQIRAAVAGLPGLAVCGAAYDGVGIPACAATAATAASQITAYLNGRGAGKVTSEPRRQ